MKETLVQSLGWEDPREEEMATHSSVLAWRILWRSLVVYSPQGHKESDTTEWLNWSGSETGNTKLKQIDMDDDKFRLNMLNLRYLLNIQWRCFVGSWEYGFDSPKEIWGRRIDFGDICDIVIYILVVVEIISGNEMAKEGKVSKKKRMLRRRPGRYQYLFDLVKE